jgi:hypothetical protein
MLKLSFRRKQGGFMAKYGSKAGKYVEKEMREHKHKGKYQSKKQAIAVGLSEAREHGVRVPKKDDS